MDTSPRFFIEYLRAFSGHTKAVAYRKRLFWSTAKEPKRQRNATGHRLAVKKRAVDCATARFYRVNSTQVEHILHVVQTRLTPVEPQGSANSALSEGHATGCLVGDFETLTLSGK